MEVRVNGPKWSQRSAAASADYVSGTSTPKRPWAEATAAAETNFAAGIADAVSRGAFAKGVQAAGDAAWRNGIQEKGRTRYSQGVSIAQNEYQAGFAPFADSLRSVTLQPRGPKGQNYGRVQQVGDALRARKLQG